MISVTSHECIDDDPCQQVVSIDSYMEKIRDKKPNENTVKRWMNVII